MKLRSRNGWVDSLTECYRAVHCNAAVSVNSPSNTTSKTMMRRMILHEHGACSRRKSKALSGQSSDTLDCVGNGTRWNAAATPFAINLAQLNQLLVVFTRFQTTMRPSTDGSPTNLVAIHMMLNQPMRPMTHKRLQRLQTGVHMIVRIDGFSHIMK